MKMLTHFDLTAIPEDLHVLLTEKMDYKTLAKFNECSKFSKQICEAMPSNTRHHLQFFVVDLQIRQFCLTKFHIKEIPVLENLPSNVFLKTAIFKTAHADQNSLHFVKKLAIRADELIINEDSPNKDSLFVQQLLKLLEPNELIICYASKDILNLPELRKLKKIGAATTELCNSQFLLNLQAPEISINVGNRISKEVFIEFLKQWARGERTIDEIELLPEALNIKTLYMELGCKNIPSNEDGKAILGRISQGNDFISITEEIDHLRITNPISSRTFP